jgi:hypothetical protein
MLLELNIYEAGLESEQIKYGSFPNSICNSTTDQYFLVRGFTSYICRVWSHYHIKKQARRSVERLYSLRRETERCWATECCSSGTLKWGVSGRARVHIRASLIWMWGGLEYFRFLYIIYISKLLSHLFRSPLK